MGEGAGGRRRVLRADGATAAAGQAARIPHSPPRLPLPLPLTLTLTVTPRAGGRPTFRIGTAGGGATARPS